MLPHKYVTMSKQITGQKSPSSSEQRTAGLALFPTLIVLGFTLDIFGQNSDVQVRRLFCQTNNGAFLCYEVPTVKVLDRIFQWLC